MRHPIYRLFFLVAFIGGLATAVCAYTAARQVEKETQLRINLSAVKLPPRYVYAPPYVFGLDEINMWQRFSWIGSVVCVIGLGGLTAPFVVYGYGQTPSKK